MESNRGRRGGAAAVGKRRGGSGSSGRGRGMGGRQINRDGRRRGGRGGRGGGSHFYSLNDRVMALWASENKYYRATVSSVHWDGTYGIVFDMENDKEYLGQREEQLQPIKNYTYEVEQKVKALFVKDDRWYDAKIVSIESWLLCRLSRIQKLNMSLDLYTRNIPLTQKARFWSNYVSALKGEFVFYTMVVWTMNINKIVLC